MRYRRALLSNPMTATLALLAMAFALTGCQYEWSKPHHEMVTHVPWGAMGITTSAEKDDYPDDNIDYDQVFPDQRQSHWVDRMSSATWGFRDLTPPKTPLGSLRKNPSPEMRGIAHTTDQRANYVARYKNTTQRQIIDDWDRLIWFQHKPTRLSWYPIP